MSYIEIYKKRVGHSNITNSKTRLIYEARRNFERSLKNDPSSMTVKITDVGEINISDDTKLVSCIINDYSENDQKTLDEKVLYVRHDENVGIGSYVEFDNFIWLVIFREHRSANIYKSFIMRKCNQILKYEYQDKIYDIPCVVKNLTQYSDGLQDIVYTSTPDSRRSIMYSQNYITSNIELGQRFIINNKRTFRITHIQDFEYKEGYEVQDGISTCIAVYTSLRDDDDVENNIAYNENTAKKSDEIMIASSVSYKVDDNSCVWEVEYTSNKTDYVDISSNEGICKITLDMDFDLIGETFKLRASSLDNTVIFEKDIMVVGFI